VVSADRPGWLASLWGGAVTGSFVAGFVQGFVLFLSLPLKLGVPFGGFIGIGGTVAVGLWLYLLHVLVLVGFALTQRIEERGGVPWRLMVDEHSQMANTLSHDYDLPGPAERPARVRTDR
jgi:membrane protein